MPPYELLNAFSSRPEEPQVTAVVELRGVLKQPQVALMSCWYWN
jgi:hypothetical protein